MDFFITGKLFFFNKCNELNIKNNQKNHIQGCTCKIKVKTIANIAIDALIFILKEFTNNFNKNINKNYISNDNQSNQTNLSNKSIIKTILKI